MPRLFTALAAAALMLIAGTASAQGPFTGVMAAVDTCLAATGLHAIDPARLTADGWTEQVIENVENSPTHDRLFSKNGSGALIFYNFDRDNGTPHCHVVVVRTAEGAEALMPALTGHLGGPFLPGDQGLGPDSSAMRVPGRPFILVLVRQPNQEHLMADIHIMPTDGSE